MDKTQAWAVAAWAGRGEEWESETERMLAKESRAANGRSFEGGGRRLAPVARLWSQRHPSSYLVLYYLLESTLL